MKHTVWVLLVVGLLGGCATNIPLEIRTPPTGNPTVGVAHQAPARYVGTKVRWGGTIASVQNRAKETWLEIVSRPLNSSGRPIEGGATGGRFLARVGTFLDPAVYAKGRAVTVAGTLQGTEKQLIGQYPYVFPVVRVATVYLWPRLPEAAPYYPYDPFYDPFWYDPWYPFYRPWPYHRHW